MGVFDSSASFFENIEGLLNRWLLKLFPVWYITQATQTLELSPIGRLNPQSFLAKRWLHLKTVSQTLSTSLEQAGPEWLPLTQQLAKLLVDKELTRSFSVTGIQGVEQSQHDENWPSLIAYANQLYGQDSISSHEDFNAMVSQAFPDEKRPHRIVYREWDGRAYWLNPEEPTLLAQLQLYAHLKQRHAQFYAALTIESLNSKILDKIRHQWWLLVVNKDSVQDFVELVQKAELPITLADFEPQRDELGVLVAPKSDHRLNKVLLKLIHRRSSKDIIELGSYISRKHHPLTKRDKGGDISPNSG